MVIGDVTVESGGFGPGKKGGHFEFEMVMRLANVGSGDSEKGVSRWRS